MGEDRLLLLVFLQHKSGPGVLDPAVQATMIDGRLDPCAEQGSGLATRQVGSQSHRLAGDPRAGVLTRRKEEESIERTDILADRIAHLPTVEARPAEAGQQIKGAPLDPPQSRALGLEIAYLQGETRLHKQLVAGLLHDMGNLGFQRFQGHPFRAYTDSDRRFYGGHGRLTSCLAGPGPR